MRWLRPVSGAGAGAAARDPNCLRRRDPYDDISPAAHWSEGLVILLWLAAGAARPGAGDPWVRRGGVTPPRCLDTITRSRERRSRGRGE